MGVEPEPKDYGFNSVMCVNTLPLQVDLNRGIYRLSKESSR